MIGDDSLFFTVELITGLEKENLLFVWNLPMVASPREVWGALGINPLRHLGRGPLEMRGPIGSAAREKSRDLRAPDSTGSSSLRGYRSALQSSACTALLLCRATGAPSPRLFIRLWGLAQFPTLLLPSHWLQHKINRAFEPTWFSVTTVQYYVCTAHRKTPAQSYSNEIVCSGQSLGLQETLVI